MKLFALLLCVVLWPSSAGAQSKSEKEWQDVIAAAKKEGKVVVAGSPDPVMESSSSDRSFTLRAIGPSEPNTSGQQP